ncbi:PQQ-dependent sugar dehydrogenase [Ureibacillus sinduriensis]|uniref:Quinoprotein glucose dehydrogenase n=1 Tax=Ureibacillus sinduriensis BLB-1 = JCM 15800 TaxID=1384057 RepID=A0A0A3IRK2_9BACL|nr:sorbosone dehydrogenase family protein [Ureibacillus sinduriensis]KGR77462.1 quinoprotein glucose dehydrogenase [Ureibacillus sinduriensis BLB-1 = JCM 15800]
MKKIAPSITVICFLLVGCSLFSTENTSTEPEEQMVEVTKLGNDSSEATLNNIEPEIIVENLTIPWTIEKLDDVIYLTERTGGIEKIVDGQATRQHVELEKRLSTASEAGLLGFALAPDFEQSNSAFAYYTYNDDSGQFNRIVTLHLNGDTWTEEKVLLDRIPSGSVHHGGRLEIGPDDKLYATTGDALQSSIAQDANSLGGKILRMNLDGSIPSDNPIPNSYVYSLGHRNPQGLAWAEDGTMFGSEHGNDANDEINIIEAGNNYGWPLIKGNDKRDGFVSPLFTSGSNKTWAPSGISYYQGKLFVAALRGQAVLEFDLITKESRPIVLGLGRIRDVLVDKPYLYFISNNTDGRGTPEVNDDKLYRIKLPNN